jgi:5-methylcytosine-specific restriction endonuclease McrA
MSFKYRKKRTGPVESVDEYLARGGQINTINPDSKKYLSPEDREYGNDQKMRQQGYEEVYTFKTTQTKYGGTLTKSIKTWCKPDKYDDGSEFDSKNVPFDIRSKFYETKEWKSLRYKFIKTKKTEELVCVQCGAGPFTKENWESMNVDHIKPVKHFWEERLNIDNLQILCWICNRVKMNHYNEPFKLGDGAKSVLQKTKKKKAKGSCTIVNVDIQDK